MSDFEYEYECPGCRVIATFSEGPLFGALQCGSCGYTPPASIREEIRKSTEENESEYPQ